MPKASKTPTMDKYGLHPVGGYCTCFSAPYSTCEICSATKKQVQRWEALSPQDRAKAEAEYQIRYPRTSNQDGR